MDQLDFLSTLIKHTPRVYRANDLYAKYKQFITDGNNGVAMTANMFARKLKGIEGVIKVYTKYGVEYYIDKTKMKNHLDGLDRESIELELANAKKHSHKRKRIGERKTKRKSEIYAGVYVLKLGGLPHTHYVGCSKTVLARIEQHRRGVGAVCTAGATSIEVLPLLTLPLKKGDDIDLDSWERAETLTLMYTIGIDKVRGWHYVQRELSDDDRRSIHRNICSYNSLCHRCGFSSHMMTKCSARERALWMGGGAL